MDSKAIESKEKSITDYSTLTIGSNDSIKQCVHSLVQTIEQNYSQLNEKQIKVELNSKESFRDKVSDESIGQEVNVNSDLNESEFNDEFWSDFEFDMICDNKSTKTNEIPNCSSVKSGFSGQELTKTNVISSSSPLDSSLDFKRNYELLLNQLSAECPTVDRSDSMATKLLTQLDSINDAILKLKDRLTQQ